MEGFTEDSEVLEKKRVRRVAGRMVGMLGVGLAILGVIVAFFASGTSILAGVVGISLGVAGYLLGSRRAGGAAVVFGLAALFVSLSVYQNLFP